LLNQSRWTVAKPLAGRASGAKHRGLRRAHALSPCRPLRAGRFSACTHPFAPAGQAARARPERPHAVGSAAGPVQLGSHARWAVERREGGFFCCAKQGPPGGGVGRRGAVFFCCAKQAVSSARRPHPHGGEGSCRPGTCPLVQWPPRSPWRGPAAQRLPNAPLGPLQQATTPTLTHTPTLIQRPGAW